MADDRTTEESVATAETAARDGVAPASTPPPRGERAGESPVIANVAKAAENAALCALASNDPEERVTYAVKAHIAAYGSHPAVYLADTISAVEDDLHLLLRLAETNEWTDDTPVDPGDHGPLGLLWPNGLPEPKAVPGRTDPPRREDSAE